MTTGKKEGIFVEVGIEPGKWKIVKLSEVATIQTGIAKGKKNIRNPVKLPYLRVANVQDGYLDLSVIKEIEVESTNIERFLLKKDDILLTEGGDYDKLGRGHIWHEQLPICLHQNHIFVVRTDKKVLDPNFLSYLTASDYGRKYFLQYCRQFFTNNSTGP
jgi:type I restriction enzyme S subunit